MKTARFFAAVLCILCAMTLSAQTEGWDEDVALNQTTTPRKVGIGTTAPEYRLHVFESADLQLYTTVQNPSTGSNASANLRAYADAAVIDVKAHGTGRSLSRWGVSLAGWSEIVAWPNGLAIGTATASPLILGTNGQNRLQITAAGDVGIGGAPSARFGVSDTRDHGFTSHVYHNTVVDEVNAAQNDHGSFSGVRQVVNSAVNNGVIVGTHSAAARAGAGHSFRVIGAQAFSNIEDGATGSVYEAIGLVASVSKGTTGTVQNGYGIYIEAVNATNSYGIFQDAGQKNFFRGNIGIGTLNPAQALHVIGSAVISNNVTVEDNLTVNDNLTVHGNVAAKYQDLAEWVPATEDLAPGTVVVLDPEVVNQVMPSSRPYDTSVAGVVSAQPGIILGEAGPSKEQIATTGRVKVRVDATASPVRIGDLLVTGSRLGMAMKSQAVDIAGVAMHRPGTVIGKALEPLSGGVGEILVLLSLQ